MVNQESPEGATTIEEDTIDERIEEAPDSTDRLLELVLAEHPPSEEAGAAPLPESLGAGPERVEISAERELVLRCGKASITLTRSGKILIRGAYLVSRSSGVNRVQGGSVQIN